MFQVRSNFVREAALLLADLAGQPERGGPIDPQGFLTALASNMDGARDRQPSNDLAGNQLLSQNASFFELLQQETSLATTPKDASLAYSRILSQYTAYDGLYWPVDMKV